MKRELPTGVDAATGADPALGGPAQDERVLAPPPSDAERALAERLRGALDDAEAPRPRTSAELSAEVEAQVRAAILLQTARLTAAVVEPTRARILETLARTRARIDAAHNPHRRSGPRVRWILGISVAAALAASLVLPIVLRPVSPAPRDARGYAKLFPEPFARDTRPVERLDRMITWRREKR